MSDERRETIDASHVSRLASPCVSCLASRAFVGPNWPTHPFEHLFSEPSRNGFYSPNPTGPISAKIIGMGTLFHSDLVRAVDSQETNISPTEFDRFSVRSGDLLFGRRSLVESGAGKVSLVCSLSESAIFESSLIRVRLNENLALPQFYLYFFKSRHGRSIVSSIVTGTNVKGIRSSELSKILVPLPPLSEQRRIVDILSAYDDLIENNRKRIALLEESARRLYKEWFGKAGRQGFCGRQEKRDLGHVSCLVSHVQFRVTTLGDICKTIGGGTPKTGVAEYWDGDIPWVVPTDITRNFCMALLDTERKITLAGLQKSSAKMLPERTILMTSRASVGYFGMADFPVCTNQGFISIIPNRDIWRWYLLFNLMSRVEEIRGKAKGSTFPEISKSSFRGMDIAIPSDDVLVKFNGFVEPLIKQVYTLAKQSRTLAAARDALLPWLMRNQTCSSFS